MVGSSGSKTLYCAALVKAVGVSPDTTRHYERIAFCHEPREPSLVIVSTLGARWPSGKARVCKTLIGGSISPRASKYY